MVRTRGVFAGKVTDMDNQKMAGLGVAVLLLGCGEVLDQRSEAEPLTVINARLTGDPSSVSGDSVAFAVMWEPPTAITRLECGDGDCSAPDGREDYDAIAERNREFLERRGAIDFDPSCDGRFWEGTLSVVDRRKQLEQLESRVEFEPVFPVTVTLDLLDPPPEAARYNLGSQGGSGILAVGRFVAYLDDNDNGRFDHGTPERAPETGLALSANRGWFRSDESLQGFTLIYKVGRLNLDSVDARLRGLLEDLNDGYHVFIHTDDTSVRAVPGQMLEMALDSEIRNDWFWCEETRFGWVFVADEPSAPGSCVFWNPNRENYRAEWFGGGTPVEDRFCASMIEDRRRCVDFPELRELPDDWEGRLPDAWVCSESTAVDIASLPLP